MHNNQLCWLEHGERLPLPVSARTTVISACQSKETTCQNWKTSEHLPLLDRIGILLVRAERTVTTCQNRKTIYNKMNIKTPERTVLLLVRKGVCQIRENSHFYLSEQGVCLSEQVEQLFLLVRAGRLLVRRGRTATYQCRKGEVTCHNRENSYLYLSERGYYLSEEGNQLLLFVRTERLLVRTRITLTSIR